MAEVEQFPHARLMRHGGALDAARRLYPDAPAPWLDLSTGINPNAWAGHDLAAIDFRALPAHTGLAALEAAAAAAFGASDVPIAALPGTEIGLRLLAAIGLPAPIRTVAPTYRTHVEAFPNSTSIGVGELHEAGDAGGTIVLANPNNPDGRVIAPADLLDVARHLRARGGVLVVDEAFADVEPAVSVLPHLSPDDGVLVFRSFGKFFGLAGVRLGFACGATTLVDALRRRLGDWPVSSAAIAIGTAAYADRSWIEATRGSIGAASARLDTVLALGGLTPVGACPLFRLVETDAAPALFDRLARAGILTRRFDYAPRWLRFGLPPDRAGLDRLACALGRG